MLGAYFRLMYNFCSCFSLFLSSLFELLGFELRTYLYLVMEVP